MATHKREEVGKIVLELSGAKNDTEAHEIYKLLRRLIDGAQWRMNTIGMGHYTFITEEDRYPQIGKRLDAVIRAIKKQFPHTNAVWRAHGIPPAHYAHLLNLHIHEYKKILKDVAILVRTSTGIREPKFGAILEKMEAIRSPEYLEQLIRTATS